MQYPQKYVPKPAAAIALGDDRELEVGPLLGRGSMSFVHQSVLHDARSGIARRVALKMFGPIATEDRVAVERAILQSARRGAAVLSPNVVAIYEHGVFDDRQPFLVNELVPGISLRRFLDAHRAAGRRLPLDLALFITVEVAAGLAAARATLDVQGEPLDMVHGELSAREVLLSHAGEVKVCDFELAGARQAASSVRNLKLIAQRAVSLAPEVVSGMPSDARSDVFSIGLLLREMLVGPRFTEPAHHAEIIALAREGAMDQPAFRPRLPRALFDVLTAALALTPADRFADAAALDYELRRVALSLGVGDMRVFLRSEIESLGLGAPLTRPTSIASAPPVNGQGGAPPTELGDGDTTRDLPCDLPRDFPRVESVGSALRPRAYSDGSHASSPEQAFRERWGDDPGE